jgi:hypothetical protein
VRSRVRSFWHLRLVYPDGNFYRKWSLMMALPMIYTAIITPLYIGLLDGTPRPVFVIDRVMDVIFISDMVRAPRCISHFPVAPKACSLALSALV